MRYNKNELCCGSRHEQFQFISLKLKLESDFERKYIAFIQRGVFVKLPAIAVH